MGKRELSWQDMLLAAKENFEPGDSTEEITVEQPASEKNSGVLDVILEKKGRAGKMATIVSGFTISDEAVKEIASKLKTKLGTGGSARGGEILIQGDRRKDVLDFLKSQGLKARII